LKVEKIFKFDSKRCCNILLCKYMVKEPPPKYVMLRKSFFKKRVLTMFNNDCFGMTCNMSAIFKLKHEKLNTCYNCFSFY